MKFGQDYQVALARGEYPKEWIDSAISYKKLKKCIKRVQKELLSLGLDKEALEALWQYDGSDATGGAGKEGGRLMQYSINGSETINFTPKLTIAIDPHDGSPMDAWLSPDTRRILRRMARSSRVNGQIGLTNGSDSNRLEARNSHHDDCKHQIDGEHQSPVSDGDSDGVSVDGKQQLETVEIPLTSDSEFFQILRRELTDLERLQYAEQDRLQTEITRLGNELRELKSSKSRKSKQEVEAWRKVFEMYSDAEVFLSSHEVDAGARDAAHAQNQLQYFNKSLSAQQTEVKKLGRNASVALDRFLRINVHLLRLIKFQEINRTALTKIMKKFDKQTSLHAQATVSSALQNAPSMTKNLAKATCFTISQEILNIIPQLNDYLCPICFSLSWKPVRLQCKHVFCIRCLIVLQRQGQHHCPLCREDVVMEATNGKKTPQSHDHSHTDRCR
jgi:hypothetical protein